MKVKCSNCGEEYEVNAMIIYRTGKKSQYMCPKCDKKGHSDVTFRNKRYLRGE